MSSSFSDIEVIALSRKFLVKNNRQNLTKRQLFAEYKIFSHLDGSGGRNGTLNAITGSFELDKEIYEKSLGRAVMETYKYYFL